jgi:hypothetical protein
MSNELNICQFIQRIKSLQSLCSPTNANSVAAILVVPGVDGRNNRESLGLLKYIFGAGVGRELLDVAVADDDILEEIVLLIQENAVSVVYSLAAKARYGAILSHCPCLIEYVPRHEEEQEVILFIEILPE